MCRLAAIMLVALGMPTAHAAGSKSQCYGTVSNGRIENSVKLPEGGGNFRAYSSFGTAAGRTYVHSKVAEIIVAAYEELARSQPSEAVRYAPWPAAPG